MFVADFFFFSSSAVSFRSFSTFLTSKLKSRRQYLIVSITALKWCCRLCPLVSLSLPWAKFGGFSGSVNWLQHEFRHCCRCSSFSSPDLSKLITVQLSERPLYWSFGQRHYCSLCTENFELSRFSAQRTLGFPVCVSIWAGRWKKSYKASWFISRVLSLPPFFFSTTSI